MQFLCQELHNHYAFYFECFKWLYIDLPWWCSLFSISLLN